MTIVWSKIYGLICKNIKEPHEAYRLALRTGQRLEQYEDLIASCPWSSLAYATQIVQGRWPEGEAAIATSAGCSYEHALKIGQRFPAGEAIIATDAGWSCHYARNVIKGRWPEGEAAIATSAGCSYDYARDIINGRFPAGEAAIATSAGWSYCYARDVIKCRWPAGEASIAKDPIWRKRYLKSFPDALEYWQLKGWVGWFDDV